MSALAPFLLPVILLFGYVLGLFALISSRWARSDGYRVGPFMAVPLVAGLLIIGGLAIAYPADSLGLIPQIAQGGLVAGGVYGLSPIWSLPIALGVAFLALAVGQMLIKTIPGVGAALARAVSGRLARASSLTSDVIRGIGLAAGIAVIGASAAFTSNALAARAGQGAVIAAIYSLPGAPTSIVMSGPRTGYVALGEGMIARFSLPDSGGSLSTTTVAQGLTFPRGLAIKAGKLYAIDLGKLPCANPFPICRFDDAAGELGVLQQSRARVVTWPIHRDGSLGDEQTIISDLPVISTEHAPNSIVIGPDGKMYMFIGGPDVTATNPSALSGVQRPHQDLLGTVVRFNPDGSGLEIYARGIRNVFTLAFDTAGDLYGVENDGPTARGYEHEGILDIRHGADFGFPAGGTFDPGSAKNRPFYLLDDDKGSAGLEWAPNAGLDPGLLVGSLGRVEYVTFSRDAQGAFINTDVAREVVLDGLQGFVPVVRATSDGKLLVGVFGAFRGYRNALIQLQVARPAS
jgi:Glucose / Sorbosone dehydrogenase